MWELTYGDIPAGMIICHRCDNPPCVRPEHLFLGTQADNQRDRKRKGRSGRGEKNGRAKLTARAVREIRARYARGDVSQAALGAEYGVSQPAIGFVVRGEHWR
jgi:hypothetical protein